MKVANSVFVINETNGGNYTSPVPRPNRNHRYKTKGIGMSNAYIMAVKPIPKVMREEYEVKTDETHALFIERNQGIEYPGPRNKKIHNNPNGLKNEVMAYIKQLGGVPKYSGNQTTMFITGNSIFGIEEKVIEKFGFGLPFGLYTDVPVSKSKGRS